MDAFRGLVDGLLAFYALHELPGLFLFLLVEEMGVPLLIPGDALIMAAGARTGRSLGGMLLALAVPTVAATLGSSVLYAVVRRGGRPMLARYGRFLHLNEERVGVIEGWFRRYGWLAIVVGRLVPGLRTPTSVMAGLFGVPYRTFAPATALAAALWAALYFFLGTLLERQAHLLVTLVLGHAKTAAAIVVAPLVVVSLVVWLRRRAGVDPARVGPRP